MYKNKILLWMFAPITLITGWSIEKSLPQNYSVAQTPSLSSSKHNLSPLEQRVIVEMNKARTNPSAYAAILQDYRKRFQGKRVLIGERLYLQTEEGVAAVDEAFAFFKRVRPVPALTASRAMSLAARDHVQDQGKKGITGHNGSDGSTPFNRLYKVWEMPSYRRGEH